MNDFIYILIGSIFLFILVIIMILYGLLRDVRGNTGRMLHNQRVIGTLQEDRDEIHIRLAQLEMNSRQIK